MPARDRDDVDTLRSCACTSLPCAGLGACACRSAIALPGSALISADASGRRAHRDWDLRDKVYKCFTRARTSAADPVQSSPTSRSYQQNVQHAHVRRAYNYAALLDLLHWP